MKIIKLLILSALLSGGGTAYSQKQFKLSPTPNSKQIAWQQSELGVVFHYDLHVFDNKRYTQGSNRLAPVNNYNIFNPQDLDTDQWIKSAKDMGAKFAILTVTHETGFALYQSDVNPYCLKAIKWKDGKGDIVQDFINSCNKYGIKPGLYVGIRWNSFFGVHDFQVVGTGPIRDQRQQYYKTMCENMVKELCTRYGDLFEIWFDGGADSPENGAPDVLPIVKKYQPNCLFYHNNQLAEARWGGSESGTVGYPCWSTFPFRATGTGESAHKEIAKNDYQLLKNGDPNGKYWMPAMADAPLRGINGRHEWFWEPNDENNIFSLATLENMYMKSVGRNATLIMGITPDPNGLIPQGDVNRMKELGQFVAQFNHPIEEFRSYTKDSFTIKLNSKEEINTIVLEENIEKGEHIRNYSIEGLTSKGWKQLCYGTSIGNKRIEKIDPIFISELKIKVNEKSGDIDIKRISVFLNEYKKINNHKKREYPIRILSHIL